MRNWKKLTALLLTGVLSVSMLAGCGGEKSNTPAAGTAEGTAEALATETGHL